VLLLWKGQQLLVQRCSQYPQSGHAHYAHPAAIMLLYPQTAVEDDNKYIRIIEENWKLLSIYHPGAIALPEHQKPCDQGCP
jgi:hypothetical protein